MASAFSGKQVIRAGELVADKNLRRMDPLGFDRAMDCLSYWRGEHALPLEQGCEELVELTSQVEKHPVFSRRLKRADSIKSKLRICKGMSLKRMQEVGSCRVVVASNKKVIKLARLLVNSMKGVTA